MSLRKSVSIKEVLSLRDTSANNSSLKDFFLIPFIDMLSIIGFSSIIIFNVVDSMLILIVLKKLVS